MLVHTLARGGYTSSRRRGSAPETRRGWREHVYIRVYACRCTGILGVLAFRLAVEELRARNARTKRKKAMYRHDEIQYSHRGATIQLLPRRLMIVTDFESARDEPLIETGFFFFFTISREIRVATRIIGFPSVFLAWRKTAIEKRKRISVRKSILVDVCNE